MTNNAHTTTAASPVTTGALRDWLHQLIETYEECDEPAGLLSLLLEAALDANLPQGADGCDFTAQDVWRELTAQVTNACPAQIEAYAAAAQLRIEA